MKKPNPSLFYFFALVAFSHPSFAQDAAPPAATQQGPKIVTSHEPPPPAVTLPPMDGPLTVFPPAKLPNVVLAPDAGNSAPAATEQAPKIVTNHEAPPPDVTLPMPAQMPSLPPAKMPNVVLRHDEVVSMDDLRDLKVKVVFKGLNAQLTGSLPKFCVDSMRMDVVPQDRTGNEDSDSDDVDSESSAAKRAHRASHSGNKEISDQGDLDNHTVVYGTRVIFKAGDKYNTLEDCVKGEAATDLKSLASSNYLSKSVLLEKDYARIGFMDSANHVTLGGKGSKSESYARLEAILRDISNPPNDNCAACNFDPNAAIEGRKELDALTSISPALRKARFDVNLNPADLDTILASIKDLRGAKNFRDRLRKFASEIPTLGLDEDAKLDAYSTIETYYDKLQHYMSDLAKNDPEHANQYSMMISENAKVMATTPGMTDHFIGDQKNAISAYARGGEMYYQFTAAYNPNSTEVRRYYDKLNPRLNAALGMVNSQMCMAVKNGQDNNTRDANACARAYADANDLGRIVMPLRQSLNTAESQMIAQTAANSFTGTTPPAGSHPLQIVGNPNNGGSILTQSSNVNSLYTLNPDVFGTTSLSQYQPQAPIYQQSSQSQYNNAVAVPLLNTTPSTLPRYF